MTLSDLEVHYFTSSRGRNVVINMSVCVAALYVIYYRSGFRGDVMFAHL